MRAVGTVGVLLAILLVATACRDRETQWIPLASTADTAQAVAGATAAGCPHLVQSGPAFAVAPPDETWYDHADDPATPENEAARDIALCIDPADGKLARHTEDWFAAGRPVAIFVGGTSHEDYPEPSFGAIQAFLQALSETENGCPAIPMVQVDYRMHIPMGSVLNKALYGKSVQKGLGRTRKLFQKVLSAGAGKVVLFGKSKGADIAATFVLQNRTEPRLAWSVVIGVPAAMGLGPQAAPSWDPVYHRSGLFRYEFHEGEWYDGKLIVFNRFSDPAANFPLLPWTSPMPDGHNYARVWADPAFQQRILDVLAGPVHAEHRAEGKQFDF